MTDMAIVGTGEAGVGLAEMGRSITAVVDLAGTVIAVWVWLG
jgi:hypothetical protein